MKSILTAECDHLTLQWPAGMSNECCSVGCQWARMMPAPGGWHLTIHILYLIINRQRAISRKPHCYDGHCWRPGIRTSYGFLNTRLGSTKNTRTKEQEGCPINLIHLKNIPSRPNLLEHIWQLAIPSWILCIQLSPI